MKFPAVVQKHFDAELEKAKAAYRAELTAGKPADVSGKSSAARPDLRTAVGLRMKSLWMHHPMHASKASDASRAWAAKAAGAFEGVFGAGGSLLSEEYSSEIIELLRPSAVLLKAGARKETYNGKLNIGKLNGGATAEFVVEGGSPTPSKVQTGSVILSSFKLMGIYEPTNDMLRNPSLDSAGLLSDDLLAAMGLAADKAFFMGDGTGPNPLGLIKQLKAGNKIAGVALTQANRANVIKFIDSFEQKVKSSNLDIEGNRPFWVFSSAVESALKGLYFDSGGWIFRDQLNQGKLNGKPVFITEAFGDSFFFFGLANQFYVGMDTKGGDNVLLDMSQPNFASDLTMIRAIMYCDAKARHTEAGAWADDVTLS